MKNHVSKTTTRRRRGIRTPDPLPGQLLSRSPIRPLSHLSKEFVRRTVIVSERGIRTPETCASTVFKTASFDHSDISPIDLIQRTQISFRPITTSRVSNIVTSPLLSTTLAACLPSGDGSFRKHQNGWHIGEEEGFNYGKIPVRFVSGESLERIVHHEQRRSGSERYGEPYQACLSVRQFARIVVCEIKATCPSQGEFSFFPNRRDKRGDALPFVERIPVTMMPSEAK